ncbi:sulfatase [Parabacteroides johnsonii]|uniref:sulfatase family protein n=1 Tax=Parabacteroides johnsonii TaxID=387661 RepID=UPI0011DCD6F1|nr:sulfatase [Parabacteroides johnsonii]MBP3641340.1 sulfatase [Parabacteroides sp.]
MNLLSKILLLSLSSTVVIAKSNDRKTTNTRRPNILFVINDDQSHIHTSFAGSHFVNTPGFDKVATNGIYFTNCYAGSPGSAPSRSSLVTGRHHWQNEQAGQHASSWIKKYIPFVDLLKANGYYTGYTGKGVDPFQYARNEADSLWRTQNAAGKAYNKYKYEKDTPHDSRTANGISRINYSENFRDFMQQRKDHQPFYFWYGSSEPHRAYEKGSWKRNGKKLDQVDIPGFIPDSEEIRGDMLDYAVEIEWADSHLCQMINHLDSIGELNNTIIIVTADNGMPFPRAKANCFEYGIHIPMAISYPNGFPAGRRVDDLISFIDLAPTILELAGIKPEGMQPLSGKSIVNILKSEKSGLIDKNKKYVFAGRERHSSSRWNNLGYPQRAIRGTEYLLIWNIKPERWPAGAPQAMNKKTGEIYPMYGLDQKGVHHPEWAFTDVDAAPSKSYLIENYNNPEIHPFFKLAYTKRLEFELYNVNSDPYCLNNLSGKPEYKEIEHEMKTELMKELKKSADPRVTGPEKEIFDTYVRYSPTRDFPKPDWQE